MQYFRTKPFGVVATVRASCAAIVLFTLAPSIVAQLRVPPGGAPLRETGSINAQGYVRVIDGDTIETYIRGNQVGIGLLGIDAPEINTPCGRTAANALEALLGFNGALLDEDLDNTFDRRLRRLYRVVAHTRDLSLELVRAGLARAVGTGKNRNELHRAEAEARAAKRGCLWSNPSVDRQTAADDLRQRTALLAAREPGEDAEAGKNATTKLAAVERQAIGLASGFTYDVVAAGFVLPTTFATLPDGRILIAEQAGVVRIYKNGAVLPTPFLDIRDRVNAYWDRGLIGLAVDPAFASNGYVYVFYTYENNASEYSGPKTARLTRVTAVGDTASVATEHVILGSQVAASCNDLPAGSDCIGSEAPSHSAGNIRFAADGTMFVTVGDGASFNVVDDDALRAQQLDSLNGKVLHITRDGLGIASNPYWNGVATANRSKVYAHGVRNSFRFTLRPGTSIPVSGEVGWGGYDEINVATSGANLGWPCYEGTGRQLGYESKPLCQSLYANPVGIRPPLIEIPHNGLSAAAVGGDFYTGTLYPAQYRGALFYGDYAANTLYYAQLDTNNNLTGPPVSFATEADGPVEIRNGPDQNLYYLSIITGELRRIRYRSSPDSVPPAVLSTSPANGSANTAPDAVVSVTFSEEIQQASVTNTTFTLTKVSSGTSVTAAVSYDEATRTARLTPGSNLAFGERYQARILGGVSGIRDLAGNPLPSNVTIFFTVVSLPTAAVTQLSDLQWTYMTNGWGPAERDRSNGEIDAGDGRQLAIGSSTYAEGLGVHAESDVRYFIGGVCSQLQADVGVDEEVGMYGSVVFEVWADGLRLFGSSVRRGTDPPLPITVDITGRNELRLVVKDAGDSAGSDHADWANARVTCSNSGDVTPPSVVSRTPTPNATSVPTTTSVQAVVSESLDPATVTPAAFQVIPEGDTRSVAATIAYENSTRTITLIPSPPLQTLTRYTALLPKDSGIKDLAGNSLSADVTWTFTTASAEPNVQYLSDMSWSAVTNGWGPVELDKSNGGPVAGDGNPLTIQGVSYAKGLGVHARSTIRYPLGGTCTTFLADIGIDDEVGQYGSVSFQVWGDGSLLFSSGVFTGIMASQSVTVDITGRNELTLIADGGADIDSDHANWANARVACAGSNTKPTAVIAAPAATLKYKVGDVINFSGSASDQEDGSLPATALSWTVTIRHCPGGNCHVHPFLSYTGAASSFVIPDHGDDSHFEIQLTAKDSGGLIDIKKVTIQPLTVQITIDTSPTGLQVGYGEMTGTAPLVRNSIVGSTQSIYTTSPQDNRQFLSWSDNGALQHSINVGSTPATYVATFTSDSTAPTITSRSPAPNATGVPAGSPVTVTFSEPMLASSITGTTFNLKRNGTTTVVPASIAYNATTRVATLQPSTALVSGAAYTATVIGGASGVKDVAGNPLASSSAWSFTVGDTTRPTVTARSPAVNATNVATNTPVTVTFSEPMNASTVTTTTFRLVRQGTTALIAGVVTYDDAARRATLQPSAALLPGVQYTATVIGGTSGVKDLGGNSLASSVSWNFTTAGSTVTRYVSDLTWTTATNGLGPVERDRSNGGSAAGDGRVITLNGVTYSKGLGVHARSDVQFDLAGACSTFTALVGIDDEVGSSGSVTFEVWGDTTRLYRSPTLTGTSSTASVSVSLIGRSQLRLLVVQGTSTTNDHADWADAKIVCQVP